MIETSTYTKDGRFNNLHLNLQVIHEYEIIEDKIKSFLKEHPRSSMTSEEREEYIKMAYERIAILNKLKVAKAWI